MLFSVQNLPLIAVVLLATYALTRSKRIVFASFLGQLGVLALVSWLALYNFPTGSTLLGGLGCFGGQYLLIKLVYRSRYGYSKVDLWLCDNVFLTHPTEVFGELVQDVWNIGTNFQDPLTLGSAEDTAADYKTPIKGDAMNLEEAKKELQRIMVSEGDAPA